MTTKTRKTTDPATGNVVSYKTQDGRVHWAAKDAPHVVKGLAAGTLALLEEVPADAPTVPGAGDAANPGATD